MSQRPSDVVVLPVFTDDTVDDDDPTIQILPTHFVTNARQRLPRPVRETRRRKWGEPVELTLDVGQPIDVGHYTPPMKKITHRPRSLPRPMLVVEVEPASPWLLPVLLFSALILAGAAFTVGLLA